MLREINDELLISSDDDRTFLDVERRFHTCLARWEGSAAMELFVNSLMAIFDDQAVVPLSSAARSTMHAAHEAIIAALAAGDPVAAGDAMNSHVHDEYARWRSAQGKDAQLLVRWTG